ncbi:MAG: hypothetical protein B6I37_06625 [Desulfobacteraceae bacterium 4572_35.2]|nr:MAG: hypothetical protein B6I37_06625 [Desulfobacteraceae bacterium 4572_35.2]
MQKLIVHQLVYGDGWWHCWVPQWFCFIFTPQVYQPWQRNIIAGCMFLQPIFLFFSFTPPVASGFRLRSLY